jgi:formylglycine-generating enzyme required for sulfatase activity
MCSSTGFAGEFAFLVGVGDYDIQQLRKLEYSRPDVVDFRQTLLQSGFPAENIVLMHDDLKTLSNARYLAEGAKIRKEFQVLLETLEEEDTLIVALAGHGIQFRGEAASYFCPLDANLDNKSTLISIAEMMDSLGKSKPRLKLMLVDACRNDPASSLRRSSGNTPELESLSIPQLAEPPQGLVTLFSCATGQAALEHPNLGHGVFFYHVLEAFQGKGDVDKNGELTLDELVAFTKDRTRTYARLTFGATQTPRQIGSVDGAWILRSIEAQPQQITNSIGVKLVLIPNGEFLMGSTPGEIEEVLRFDSSFKKEYADDEQPRHRVRITKPFYLGVHEVTKGQFAEFVAAANYRTEAEKDGEGGWGWNDSEGKLEGRKPEYTWRNPGFSQTDSHPVVNITWNDASAFCEWLSAKEGKSYRLPTEAEWEYACRSGSRSLYQFGDDPEGLAEVGNVADGTAKAKFSNWTTISARDGFVFTAPVGRYPANRFGLHDMHGNVWEWCADWYGGDYYGQSPQDDPPGPASGSGRVLRGGSWRDSAGNCRSADRDGVDPSDRFNDLGFRVALSPSGQ